jgi:hypothetical protein
VWPVAGGGGDRVGDAVADAGDVACTGRGDHAGWSHIADPSWVVASSSGVGAVFARDAAGSLWGYPGDGAGGFQTRRQIGSGWNVMTALVTPGDVTGDRNADVLGVDGAGRLWIYPGTGTGGLSARRQIGSGWQSFTIISAGNFNGAGWPDLLARDSAGVLWLYPLSGNAAFGTRSKVGTGWNGFTILGPGDVSGDGRADILARDTAGGLWLYRGNGTGGVAAGTRVGSGWKGMSALVGPGNWDGAGGDDLLARDATGRLWLYPGNDAGGFGPARQIGSGWQAMTYIGWSPNSTAVPGPVTGVAAVPNSTSIALSWTNPTAASLTGVMIRRALGSTPPSSPSAGTLVTDVATPAMSFADTALVSGTPYSYSLFAHSATPGYASAVTVSSNTTAAGSGNVSGTVTDAGGTHHGLMNLAVGVYSPSSKNTNGTRTAADGSYTLTGLPAGTDYQVCFYAELGATGGATDALGYVDQCYNNQPNNQSSTSQTPVTVTAGATTTGINAALAVGGAVSGTVTDAGGTHHGLAHVGVSVISASVSSPIRAMLAVETAADGSYSVAGLATGTDYQVCFDTNSVITGGSSDAKGYVNQCYNNQPSNSPNPVSVTAGAATTGINAVLVGRP